MTTGFKVTNCQSGLLLSNSKQWFCFFSFIGLKLKISSFSFLDQLYFPLSKHFSSVIFLPTSVFSKKWESTTKTWSYFSWKEIWLFCTFWEWNFHICSWNWNLLIKMFFEAHLLFLGLCWSEGYRDSLSLVDTVVAVVIKTNIPACLTELCNIVTMVTEIASLLLVSNPGPHRHRIFNCREEAFSRRSSRSNW